jgi:hypothetical protein
MFACVFPAVKQITSPHATADRCNALPSTLLTAALALAHLEQQLPAQLQAGLPDAPVVTIKPSLHSREQQRQAAAGIRLHKAAPGSQCSVTHAFNLQGIQPRQCRKTSAMCLPACGSTSWWM